MRAEDILINIRRRLPASTQRIVAALGWELALQWLRRHGGKSIYMPIKYNSKISLFKGLSEYHARKLIEAFGGEMIKLPKHTRMLKSERYNHIAHDYQRGFDRQMIANKYGIPISTVSWTINYFDLHQDSKALGR